MGRKQIRELDPEKLGLKDLALVQVYAPRQSATVQ
jgi:hypothetical protein